MEELLEEIKNHMKFKYANVNNEIQSLLKACTLDLKRVGILVSYENQLIRQCHELYCKWHMNYEGKAEYYEKMYSKLRDTLSMCKEYQEKDDV